ncbi:MAG: sodium:proton antiporter [Verrucomicrobiota bacterium]
MEPFDLFAGLMVIAAACAWINFKFVRLPDTIGIMAVSLVGSILLLAAGSFFPAIESNVEEWIDALHFSDILLDIALPVLLFAGALHVNINSLRDQWLPIGVFASAGVLISTVLVAALSKGLFTLCGIEVPWIMCFLFGALISPTDPIAVLGILKTAGVPKSLETKITGESLFNDGIGVVVFLALLGFAGAGHAEPDAASITKLFLTEAGGGLLIGLIIGYLAFLALKHVNRYQVEVLITLALVLGGISICHALHASAPLAMVVAGLLIGNQGRSLAMSDSTREHLDTFWTLIDEILNALLFVLIGMELVIVDWEFSYFGLGLAGILLVLACRWISISFPLTLMKRVREFSKGATAILTWGGLRGGISIALALALPPSEHRPLILAMTYVIVIFSILVQGITLKRAIQRFT